MKINFKRFRWSLALATGLIMFTSCEKEQLAVPDSDEMIDIRSLGGENMSRKITFYGLSTSNEIVRFTTGKTAADQGAVSISGLQTDEMILAIDFRPSTGQLYGISDHSRLYTINTNTGMAIPLSANPFIPGVNGSKIGFDFNPTVDRIRLVTDNEQNLRLHPETGMVAAVDGNINPGDLDLSAAAYTNSFAGATSTTLYTIDFIEGKLFRQIPPNNGTQEEIGSLQVQETGNGGFDISPDNNVALAVIHSGFDLNNDHDGKKSNFYYVNLSTGKATPAGVTRREIIGVAIPAQSAASAVNVEK